MLHKVEVYSDSSLVDSLDIDDSDPIETDFVQVLNVDGLDPVAASIDIVSSGNVDGAIQMDAQVPTRNIVLTVRPNPDWNTWTPEQLRQFLYSYFMPKQSVKLVFTTDEIAESPVEIVGTVESCEANPFSKDPQYVVSIVCPDPYFETVDRIQITGETIAESAWSSSKTTIDYAGNIPIGIEVFINGGFGTEMFVQLNNQVFHVVGTVDGNFDMLSVPLHKYLREINGSTGAFTNLLGQLQLGSQWPVLKPGPNDFAVMGPTTGNTWTLSYNSKYGGL